MIPSPFQMENQNIIESIFVAVQGRSAGPVNPDREFDFLFLSGRNNSGKGLDLEPGLGDLIFVGFVAKGVFDDDLSRVFHRQDLRDGLVVLDVLEREAVALELADGKHLVRDAVQILHQFDVASLVLALDDHLHVYLESGDDRLVIRDI